MIVRVLEQRNSWRW